MQTNLDQKGVSELARHERCKVKKGRGEEKEETIGDQIAKKSSLCASFSSVQSSFLDQSEIYYLEESKLYLLSFSCKILPVGKLGDFQGLNIHPTPFSCHTSKNLWQS